MPFNKIPTVKIKDSTCTSGWSDIVEIIKQRLKNATNPKIVVECYQGVDSERFLNTLKSGLEPDHVFVSSEVMKTKEDIETLTKPDVTDDRIFGFLSRLNIEDFFESKKLNEAQDLIAKSSGITLVFGSGASLLCSDSDLLIYVDMARWEIQLRMRRNEVNNLGLTNHKEPFETKYKRSFFVDWRVLDRLKKRLRNKIDFWIDANSDVPKIVSSKTYENALNQVLNQPFSLVPFFDPGPWGGQWMGEKFDLDKSQENYAWCFNCVPEENSLLLQFGDVLFETPSINLVFFHPKSLMGEKVHARFGDEFPIRFDFLDTIDGGNLSLQVHPLTEYIQEKFGMHYTQDESYYMMDVKPGAKVYLGLKTDISKDELFADLRRSQKSGEPFDADKYTVSWEAKKHDHFLIPAGTIHCSGKDSMVLEISATPYIFTFKLWDWGRIGMDGKPRPINIQHGEQVIQMDRDKDWVEAELVNRIEAIASGDGWREERTGLHETEFIETRRHWFTKKVNHKTDGLVNVLNLVEGEQAIVESPAGSFEPFIVNYAETFVVPAQIDEYTIRPYGVSEGKEVATVKAFVRG